jgi:hypothetical protein
MTANRPVLRAALVAALILPVLAACGRTPAPAAPAPAGSAPADSAPAAAESTVGATLPAAAPERVVADLYGALATLRPSGAPTEAQRAALAPLLSSELVGLLSRADTARATARAAAPTEKPPFTDGDLFSSLFEGPTAHQVGAPVSGAAVPGGRLGDLTVPVTLTHVADPATGGGTPTTWIDTVLLREENGRFVVADIAFGGGWDFANKGSLVAALRAGLGEGG